jgi:Predicted ATPase
MMSDDAARGNLVDDATSFVGRQGDVDAVTGLFTEHRLVTLVGVGGVGKTRLAVQAARQIATNYPGGVWIVDLSYLSDGEALEHVVAGSMKLAGIPGNVSGRELWSRIGNQPTLVILDNCDRVVAQVARVVTDMLITASATQVLATSREPIGVSREIVFEVRPLALSTANPNGGGRDIPDAVRLFQERMHGAASGAWASDKIHAQIATLCDRLDGLPLAIELAAARTRTLSIDQIGQRLVDRFGLLSRGPSDVHPRHRSLRAVLDWSFDLCSERERQVWLRVSAFANSASLEAIESVCASDDLPSDSILDLVDTLVQKSILNRVDDHASTRYGMLDSVREYGHTRLSPEDNATTRTQHLAYYLDMARRAAEGWFGPEQPLWSRQLQSELPNIRSALDHSMLADRGEDSLELVGQLWFFWVACGFQTEGRHWAQKALARQTPTDSPARLQALWTLGWLTLIGGDIPSARALLDMCARQAADAKDETARAFATGLLGAAAGFSGDLAKAVTLYQTAVENRRQESDPASAAVLLFQLAEMQCMAGKLDEASESTAECLDLCTAAGETWCASYAHWVAGLARYFAGDADAAGRSATESFALKLSINDRLGEMLVAELAAWIAASRQDYVRAATLLAATERFWAAAGCQMMGFPKLIVQRERCQRLVDRHLSAQAIRQARSHGKRVNQFALYALVRGDSAFNSDDDVLASSSLLTRREEEVAELVGRGLTNREIADVLVIGRRTVETHVARILAKTSSANRSQLAAKLARRDTDVGTHARGLTGAHQVDR